MALITSDCGSIWGGGHTWTAKAWADWTHGHEFSTLAYNREYRPLPGPPALKDAPPPADEDTSGGGAECGERLRRRVVDSSSKRVRNSAFLGSKKFNQKEAKQNASGVVERTEHHVQRVVVDHVVVVVTDGLEAEGDVRDVRRAGDQLLLADVLRRTGDGLGAGTSRHVAEHLVGLGDQHVVVDAGTGQHDPAAGEVVGGEGGEAVRVQAGEVERGGEGRLAQGVRAISTCPADMTWISITCESAEFMEDD